MGPCVVPFSCCPAVSHQWEHVFDSVISDRVRPERVVALSLRGARVVVWPARYVALVGDARVALTKGESAMLRAMMDADGEPVTRAALAAVWSRQGKRATSRSVDMRISQLRKKLGDDARAPQLIVTVSGVGYALVVDLVAAARPRRLGVSSALRSRAGAA